MPHQAEHGEREDDEYGRVGGAPHRHREQAGGGEAAEGDQPGSAAPGQAGAEGEDDEFPGRCVAVTSSGKRCPNQALDGSRYCGVPAHRELAAKEEGAAAP